MSSPATVVILAPGTMGSSLLDRAQFEEIWPDRTVNARTQDEKLKLVTRTDLIPGQPIKKVDWELACVYEELIRRFEKSGFTYYGSISEFGSNKDHKVFLGFAYDWRADNAIAAEVLAGNIDAIYEKYSGQVDIWIVAHSMGGLVSRNVLEMPKIDTSRVKGLITLGTPHLGAPKALGCILGQIAEMPFHADTLKKLANTDGYPSTFELLPPDVRPFVKDAGGADVNIWSGTGLNLLINQGASVANIVAAEAFLKTLHDDPNEEPPVPYYLVAGVDEETVTGYTLDSSNTFNVEIQKVGDGTVPDWSALFHTVNGPKKGTTQISVNNVEHTALVKRQIVFDKIKEIIGF
ncbi:MAG: hypothetical protein GC191_12750 [Azospirillum sp.]|nr:hypothetical protein [Azospirillum sp.]